MAPPTCLVWSLHPPHQHHLRQPSRLGWEWGVVVGGCAEALPPLEVEGSSGTPTPTPACGVKKALAQLPVTASCHPSMIPGVGFESCHFHPILYGNKKRFTTKKATEQRQRGELPPLHINACVVVFWGRSFPGSSIGKESACQCRRPGFSSWVGKIP